MPLYRVEIFLGEQVVDVYDDVDSDSDSAQNAGENCLAQTKRDLGVVVTAYDEDGGDGTGATTGDAGAAIDPRAG